MIACAVPPTAAAPAAAESARSAAATFLFPPLERSEEPLAVILERTAHLHDYGPVECDHCGDSRSVGRRVGDPLYRCLPGYGCNP